MNKQEAAQYVGISVRSLERHISAGNVTPTPKRSESGQKMLDFTEEQLDRLKAMLEAQPVEVSPENRQDSPESRQEHAQGESTALARIERPSHNQLATLQPAQLASIGEALAMLATLGGQKPHPSLAELSHKMLLTIKEAALLAGVPQSMVRRAIESGALKSVDIGRGKRVRREALEKWVSKL